MSRAGTALAITIQDANGKIKEQKIDYANPNATEENLTEWVVAMNNLSDDTLKELNRVSTSKLTLPSND